MLIIIDPQDVNILEKLLDNGKVLFLKYFCGRPFMHIMMLTFILLVTHNLLLGLGERLLGFFSWRSVS